MVGAKLDIDCGNPLTMPSLLKDKYEINICNKNFNFIFLHYFLILINYTSSDV